jgi:hypothetical protein
MLTKVLQKIIDDYIAKAFDNLRLNLLGPESIGAKTITFSLHKYNPQSTLASNYLAGATINSHDPKSIDKAVMNQLSSVAENYIDALEQKSIADITRTVSEQIDELTLKAKQENLSVRDVLAQKSGQSIMKILGEALDDQNDKLNDAAERLVNHELHRAQNFGALDGIIGASKSIGIADPIVFKILVDDERLCNVCRKIWLSDDGVTPKVYKLSELAAQPKNAKDLTPAISPQHVNCRCVLSTLLPGFSFDASGNVQYVGNDHDEWAKQRNG